MRSGRFAGESRAFPRIRSTRRTAGLPISPRANRGQIASISGGRSAPRSSCRCRRRRRRSIYSRPAGIKIFGTVAPNSGETAIWERCALGRSSTSRAAESRAHRYCRAARELHGRAARPAPRPPRRRRLRVCRVQQPSFGDVDPLRGRPRRSSSSGSPRRRRSGTKAKFPPSRGRDASSAFCARFHARTYRYAAEQKITRFRVKMQNKRLRFRAKTTSRVSRTCTNPRGRRDHQTPPNSATINSTNHSSKKNTNNCNCLRYSKVIIAQCQFTRSHSTVTIQTM